MNWSTSGVTRLAKLHTAARAALAIAVIFVAHTAAAQDDPVARARKLAREGDRTAALQILEARLATDPADGDARTLYGTVLSWEGRYDEARSELQKVLADGANLDATQALIRVEIWSGRFREATSLVTDASRRWPANEDLAGLQRQITRTRSIPWSLGRYVQAGIHYDGLDRGDDWSEVHVSYQQPTRAGSVTVRAAQVERSERDDRQLEIEMYPRLREGTYAYLAAAVADDAALYPRSRYAAELFQTLDRGFEISLGYRRLNFEDSIDLYTASVSKYVGAWLFALRGFDREGGASAHISGRRYFGDDGGYVGLRIGRGSSRDDVRSSVDLSSLESEEIVGEAVIPFADRLALTLRGGYGEQESTFGEDQSRVSSAALLRIHF